MTLAYNIELWNGFQTKSEINDNQKAEIYEAVKTAIKIGYRHIDCATIYNNEKYVGEAIAEQIKLGVVKREELYVTSKVLYCNKRETLILNLKLLCV